LRQTFRYEYPEPIRDLNHRLVVIPPERFGDQRRLRHQLSVDAADVSFENRKDRFGNVIIDVFAPRVSDAIEFTAEVSVERHAAEPNRLPDGWLADGYLLEASPLTAADDRILRAAESLASSAEWGLPLADRINDWVYQSMTYQHGVTGVRTTASEALALGSGVCQDYAHVSRGGLNYVTIAVGSDYSDVAPTSGTYRSAASGRLFTRKRVTLTNLD
jgi:transglutaminase-like putative cysteine protease